MNIIEADLLEFLPFQPTLPSCPFHSRDSTKDKVTKINQQIMRMKRMNHRTNLLYYYYWLGNVLENPSLTRFQRMEIRQQITAHNYTVAIRIFRIFEFDPSQIYRTKKATTTHFIRLTAPQFRSLYSNSEFLAGTQNLRRDE